MNALDQLGLITQICAALNALILIAVFPLEAFFLDNTRVQKFLGIEPNGIRYVRLWAFCIGARNALAGIGTLIGLLIYHLGNPVVGATIVVVACIYMLLASLFMGLADLLGKWLPRGGSVRGTVASAVFPAVALIGLAI